VCLAFLFGAPHTSQIAESSFKMQVSHLLGLIDSLCVVNVFYSDFSKNTLLLQNKITVTVHRRTEAEIVEFLFLHRNQSLGLYSDGHYKSICAIFIILLDREIGDFTQTSKNNRIHAKQVSKLRSVIPRRSYFGVLINPEFYSIIINVADQMCSLVYCSFPNNLAFLIQDSYNSRIENVCSMSNELITVIGVKFEGSYLKADMSCIQIQTKVFSLDDIFTERVGLWHVLGSRNLYQDYNVLLKTPVNALENFNLKIFLRRLAMRNLDAFDNDFPWDIDPVMWYINLNLLVRSNVSGVAQKDTKFVILKFVHIDLNDRERSDILVTSTNELEGITCYHEPLMSFHMYSSPFMINLWISIVLTIIFVSAFLKVYIQFYHKDIDSSISPTLFSISLLANVSYFVPKSLWESSVFIFACLPWILCTMILSNCYQSLVISEINAPMGGEKLKNVSKYTICENKNNLLVNPPKEFFRAAEKALKNFKDNYKYEPKDGTANKQDFKKYFNAIHDQMNTFKLPNCFALLSEPFEVFNGIQHGFTSVPFVYTLFAHVRLKRVDLFEEPESPGSQDPGLVHLLLRLYPLDPNLDPSDGVVLEREAAIEKELIECKKSVYLVRKETIASETSYLKNNHKRLKFYQVKQNIVTPEVGNWKCSYHKSSKMSMLLSGFFESGILSELDYFEKYTIMLKRRKGTAVVRSNMHPIQPIHLNDSIHTVFILYAALISFAVLGIVIECYSQAFHRIIVSNINVNMLKRAYQRCCYDVRRSLNLYLIRCSQIFVSLIRLAYSACQ